MTKPYTIGIIGAGAVGLTYAALLSEVATIKIKTRQSKQADIINAQGLAFAKRTGESKTYTGIEASDSYDILKNCDAVIVAVKSYDTEQIAVELNRVFKPDAIVLTLQNGLQALDVLREIMDNPSRVYAGVTYIGASRTDERTVVNGNMLDTIVDESAGELAKLMQASQFKAELSPDIKQAMWNKMVLNTGQNALSAITDLKFGEMYKSEDCLELAGMSTSPNNEHLVSF